MKKIKVTVIGSIGVPPYLGGIENVVDTLLKSDLNTTCDFSVIDTYRAHNVKRKRIEKIYFAFNLFFFVLKKIKDFQPDLIHIHFCSGIDFWKHSICLLAGKIIKKKVIFHLHGGEFDTVYEKYSVIKKLLVTYFLNRADVLVALSIYWHDYLLKICTPKSIRIIPNPINTFKYQPTKIELKNYVQILLLGSLGKRKGHYDVLKAMVEVNKKYKNIHVKFAGLDEDYDATEKLKKISKKYKINSNIHFIGPVYGDSKINLINSSDIFILPSYGENMPISVLEGMSAGKPVISTKVGAIPEIIDDNINGFLIDPGDWKELANKIIHIIENKNEIRQIGINARKRVLDNWDVHKIIIEHKKVYKMLLNR